MHDAKGRPLAVGDHVLVPTQITSLGTTDDYCNVNLETVHGRRPDGLKERISAINTGVLVRANPGDDTFNAEAFAQPVAADQPIAA